jgi:hypothetical protein
VSALVYQRGTPTVVGVYAVRIFVCEPFCDDEFLLWDGKRWSYLGSDQYCRHEVRFWLGPLPRVHG